MCGGGGAWRVEGEGAQLCCLEIISGLDCHAAGGGRWLQGSLHHHKIALTALKINDFPFSNFH